MVNLLRGRLFWPSSRVDAGDTVNIPVRVVDTHSTAARQAGTASRVYVEFHNDRRSTIVDTATILYILAVIIGIFGVLKLIRGDILIGIVLIVVAFLVGPGGVSIFT
jgi:hypothetical protein